MKKIKLGKSDLMVSRIILGTWAIGGQGWGEYSKKDALAAIEAAIDCGINTIDTAPAYNLGHAEKMIGEILKGKRGTMIIATKCGLNMENKFPKDLSPEFIEYDLHESLKRLKTDYIDLYQCHWPDPKTPIEATMECLVKFRDQGKIRNIGVCNFSDELLQQAMELAPVVSMQPQYSLLKRNIEEDILKTCIERNTGVITYGSLGAGMLSGKYTEPPKFNKTDARSYFYKFFKPKYWPQVSSLVELLKSMAEDRGARPGQVAISWVLSREGITSAIVGARNQAQVRENVKALEIKLTPGETGELDRLSGSMQI